MPLRLGGSRRFLLAEFPIEPRTDCEDQDAHEMRRRDGSAEVLLRRVITAKRFHDRSCHGVAKEIGGEDLAIELLAAIEPGEAEVERRVRQKDLFMSHITSEGRVMYEAVHA